MNGFLEKKEEDWFVKWSDLHSFGYGTHWMYTPLHESEIVDEQILKHGEKVEFEFVTTGYNNETFMPFRYVKLKKKEEDTEQIKTNNYNDNNLETIIEDYFKENLVGKFSDDDAIFLKEIIRDFVKNYYKK